VLEAIVMKCLQKKPEQRYQSMAELAADLEAVERGQVPRATTEGFGRSGPQTLTGVEARAIGFETAPDLQIRKNRAPMLFGLAAAVVVVGLGLWFAFGRNTQPVAAGSGPDAPTVNGEAIAAPNQGQGAQGEAQGPKSSQPAAATPSAQGPAKPEDGTHPEPAVSATLNVTSQPERAEVYADGRQVGTTPYTMTKPDAHKPVTLKLRLSGYAEKQVEISDQSSDLLVTLEKEASRAASRPKSSATTATTPKRPQPVTPVAPKPTQPPKRESAPAPSTDVLDPWN
jgi:serine/threonine-protein kinase